MKRTMITLTALSFCLVVAPAVAQQKQQVTIKGNPATSKYTLQQSLEVGNVPGHAVRLFEIKRTYPDKPMVNGVAIKESTTRGISDYIDTTGANVNYTEYLLENGDKFFTRTNTVGQGDSSGKQTNMGAGVIIGGTGKLSGISGLVKGNGRSDLKAGINENETVVEYMIK
jgi:hypothetical protein